MALGDRELLHVGHAGAVRAGELQREERVAAGEPVDLCRLSRRQWPAGPQLRQVLDLRLAQGS